MKKTNSMYIKILIGMMLILCLSCDTTKPDKTQVFNVSDRDDWNNAINHIKANGDDKAYIINIQNSFEILPEQSYSDFSTFGIVQNITIDIMGNQSQHILTECPRIVIGARQDVNIINITLKGITLNILEGGRCSLYGNTLLTDNDYPAVEVSRYGRFYMYDNSKISNTVSSAAVVNRGDFYLQGNSSICDNEGWAVVISIGTFYMKENSSISRNKNGISISNGTFIMEDGSISENNSTSPSSCIVSISSGHFIMLGGSIHKNDMAFTIYMIGGLLTMSGGIVYGNLESGAPEDLANSSHQGWTTLRTNYPNEVKYGDGTNILPHIDGYIYGTNHTIVGRR